MKVLFLNYEYPPLGGGAGIATEAILGAWKDDPELEIHLVTSAVGKEYERSDMGKAVRIHRLPIGKDPEHLHSQSFKDLIAYTLKATLFLPGFIRKESRNGKFDATLAFFTIPCGIPAYLAKLFFGIPYAVSLRGADVPGFSEKYDRLYFFLKPEIRFLWKRAGKVIPNSIGIRDLALKTAPKQAMEIIENGIATDLFRPEAGKKEAGKVIFLSTSRLTKRKGIDTLVRAFAAASKESTLPLELRIIGDGEERGALEALARELGISERVEFLGRIAHEELPTYYASAHAFVLPSQNEGMSNSSLEALSSGLPLIVSRTGGMEELVTEGKNGFFVDPSDTEAFSGTLLRLARDPELLRRLSEESRRQALERGWEATARRFKEVLESIRVS